MTKLSPNLSFITLGVKDLSISRKFYIKMGLCEYKSNNKTIVLFKMNHQILALCPIDLLAKDIGVEESSLSEVNTILSQNVSQKEDIHILLNKANKLGGKIVRAASEPYWGGMRGYLSDPDGHIWEIVWNPKFKFNK